MIEKYIVKYKCGFCGFEFKKIVGKFISEERNLSSQVQCPYCSNFLPTWKDAKIIKEIDNKHTR